MDTLKDLQAENQRLRDAITAANQGLKGHALKLAQCATALNFYPDDPLERIRAVLSTNAALLARGERAARTAEDLRGECRRQKDQLAEYERRLRQLHAALRTARGWLVPPSQNGEPIDEVDLAEIDDALVTPPPSTPLQT